MHTEQVKAGLTGAWILAVGVLSYIANPASLTGWTTLAVVSVIPPIIMMKLWRVPAPSMSESIRDVLR